MKRIWVMMMAAGSALAGTVTDARVATVTLVETNWTEACSTTTMMWPPEVNRTTWHERGSVCSNTYLSTTWSNFTGAVLIESREFASLMRSYELRQVRDYRATTNAPAR